MEPQGTLLLLLGILAFGLIIPELFRKFKLPYVTSLILIGAVLGPNTLGYIKSDEIIEFFGFLGSAFLMLMAGLAIEPKHFDKLGKKIGFMAACNSLIPFATGVAITRFFGYDWVTSLIIGTIFMSSAVAIVISSLKEAELTRFKIGESITSAAVLEDVASLLLLALILQKISPILPFSLPAYVVILITSIILLKFIIPRLAAWFDTHITVHKEEEDQLRLVIVILFAALVYFSAIGVHALIAAFIVGIFLAHNITSHNLYDKLHTICYGLFVPVFFVVVGTKMDLSIVTELTAQNAVVWAIIAGSIISKVVSGYASAALSGFSRAESALFGIASTPQLTTTLAVTYAAVELGLIDTALTTAVLLLSIVTTMVAPIIIGVVSRARA